MAGKERGLHESPITEALDEELRALDGRLAVRSVAERHYLGVHRGIPKEATMLEAAMQIDEPMLQVHSSASPTSRRFSGSPEFASLRGAAKRTRR